MSGRDASYDAVGAFIFALIIGMLAGFIFASQLFRYTILIPRNERAVKNGYGEYDAKGHFKWKEKE